VARALDDDPVAVGAVVVPFLEIGIDDLVSPGDNSPARLRLPGGCGQWRVEDLSCRQDLGSRLESGLARAANRERTYMTISLWLNPSIPSFSPRGPSITFLPKQSSLHAEPKTDSVPHDP
jgi:hypothetical protein